MAYIKKRHTKNEDGDTISGSVLDPEGVDIPEDTIYVDLTQDQQSQNWMEEEYRSPKTSLDDYTDEEVEEIGELARKRLAALDIDQ